MYAKITTLDEDDLGLQVGDWLDIRIEKKDSAGRNVSTWFRTTVDKISIYFTDPEGPPRVLVKINNPDTRWFDFEQYDDDGHVVRIEEPKEITLLKEACGLLHICLEWDNGGERDYDKIIEFLNRVEGKKS
jgi:hypothetical protein